MCYFCFPLAVSVCVLRSSLAAAFFSSTDILWCKKKSVCWPSSFFMIRYEVACDTHCCVLSLHKRLRLSATNEAVTIFTISLKTLAVRMLEFA